MDADTLPHPSEARFLDAALEVIRTKGYGATTVDDLCAAAGLGKGSFFHHFESKEALALAAARRFAARADALFASAPFRSREDPLARLLGYVDFRRELLQGELAEVTCLFGTLVQETYDTHPAIRDVCERHLGEHIAWLAVDIAAAKKRHAPRARWSAESLGAFIQATLQGGFILAKASRDVAAADECLAHLRRYLVLLFDPPQPAKEQ
jgi:TetR/AcrR family transcriptional repressor of nem operon